jgi:ATP-dependent Clp protease, protease subunit
LNKYFWNWVKNDTERTLYLDGAIAETTWYGDEITPQKFKAELMAESGNITIWINSPGGDFLAASQIYNMLKDYPGKVTVKIDGLAASAASVIAMAGNEVLISPVGMLMVHNPSTLAFGDTVEMEKAIAMLNEVKESIINAFALKTGLSRSKLSRLMDDETWINSRKAVELGFADRILFMENRTETLGDEGVVFSRATVMNSIIQKLPQKQSPPAILPLPKPQGTDISTLDKRLDLLKF